MASLNGTDDGSGFGVRGDSPTATGVIGDGPKVAGVVGTSVSGSGVSAFSESGAGVQSLSNNGPGVSGQSVNNVGMVGRSDNSEGVKGLSAKGVGVRGDSQADNGVLGTTEVQNRSGVFGRNMADQGTGTTGLAEGEGGIGVFGQSDQGGYGVIGNATIIGDATSGTGVVGIGSTGVLGQGHYEPGLFGQSVESDGVVGQARSANASGVFGYNPVASGNGVAGRSGAGTGVYGHSGAGPGIFGESDANDGVVGHTNAPHKSGVVGFTSLDKSSGVAGLNVAGTGVYGYSQNGPGAYLESLTGTGAFVTSMTGIAVDVVGLGLGLRVRSLTDAIDVFGISSGISSSLLGGATSPADVRKATAVLGMTGFGGVGVRGVVVSGGFAVHGVAVRPNDTYTYAGMFDGDVNINGTLRKTSDKFLIDHPLAPAERYLEHATIESSEMKNFYDGVVELDGEGLAEVVLPEWFEALNENIRYQLTAIGGPAPELHIAQEVQGNRFRIAGGRPGLKVSWQLTGTRRDAWAQANPMVVEREKPDAERGRFLYPELFGAGPELGIITSRNGDIAAQLELRRQKAEAFKAERPKASIRSEAPLSPSVPSIPRQPTLPTLDPMLLHERAADGRARTKP